MSRERTEACDAVDDALARVSISWSKVNDAQDAEYRVAVRVWMQALMMQRSAVEIYLAEIDGPTSAASTPRLRRSRALIVLMQ